MTDLDALLRAVLLHPHEDTPRLVYADKLDDLAGEQTARSEFIRVQVELAALRGRRDSLGRRIGHTRARLIRPLSGRERELAVHAEKWWNLPLPAHQGFGDPLPGTVGVTASRGFIDSVTLSLADFAGGPCVHCPDRPGFQHRNYPGGWDRCDECSGTGRAPGHAAALFAAHPITRVVLVDREPWAGRRHAREPESSKWGWWGEAHLHNDRGRDILTTPIMAAMADHPLRADAGMPLRWRPGNAFAGGFILFDSRQDALDALTAACVSLGRSLAGLSAPSEPAALAPGRVRMERPAVREVEPGDFDVTYRMTVDPTP